MQTLPHPRIYFDNAATTRIDQEVFDAMLPFLKDAYGNPSALHSHGREARVAVERARKSIAALLQVPAATLVFTSGGTESNNMAMSGAVRDLGCTHLLYGPTEHHSVLHAVQHYGQGPVTSSPLKLTAEGKVDLADLDEQLAIQGRIGRRVLVCCMHANNETGLWSDLGSVGRCCQAHGAILLADGVCTIGHYPLRLRKLPADLMTAAAHKFHGPKGVGLLYIRDGLSLGPLLHGGGQENERRAGTEHVAGIVGMAKALEIGYRDFDAHETQITAIRDYAWARLQATLPETQLNCPLAESLYAVLSISLPRTEAAESALFLLDEKGISLSGGSACTAGAGSHVLAALGRTDRVTLRLSFSKYNRREDVDRMVAVLQEILS